MIGEPKLQAGADTSDKDQYEANAGRLAEINQKNIGELSDDELETMLAERKALRSAQTENIGRAQEEATAENAERDAEIARRAAEAKVAEDAARAEQAAAHAAKEAEDAAKATALAEQIKSGKIGTEQSQGVELKQEKTVDVIAVEAETEEQKAVKQELAEQYPDIEVSMSENFPGAVMVKARDGKKVYAVREEGGQIVGNVSGLLDGSITWTQRMHDDDRAILEGVGIRNILQKSRQIKLDSFEGLRTEERERALEQKTAQELFRDIDSFAQGRGMRFGSREELIGHMREISPVVQQKAAEIFFTKDLYKIVREGYKAYLALKGTPFATKFQELENARLQAAGYGKFTL